MKTPGSVWVSHAQRGLQWLLPEVLESFGPEEAVLYPAVSSESPSSSNTSGSF